MWKREQDRTCVCERGEIVGERDREAMNEQAGKEKWKKQLKQKKMRLEKCRDALMMMHCGQNWQETGQNAVIFK